MSDEHHFEHKFEIPDAHEVGSWEVEEDTAFSLPRPPLEETEMDITPMIDITFLLLIFFLVASKMDPDAQLVLPKARNGTAVAEATSVMITMTPGEGDTAFIYKGDGNDNSLLLSSADPADQEAELVDYIETGFDAGKTQVVIKAEKDVKHRE
ncbi:MAG: biopolymer transporter ExbD, partial [Planctomycetales bacterium]|nr:biopolymer transporter ExbD [Planctomycetales bacterium]